MNGLPISSAGAPCLDGQDAGGESPRMAPGAGTCSERPAVCGTAGKADRGNARLRLYIAGPMTGHKDLNFPAFHAAAAKVRALGHEAINPAEVNPDPEMKWADAMKADIPQLLTCDGLVALPGWTTSKGAKLEMHIAVQLGMKVFSAQEFLEDGGRAGEGQWVTT